LGDDRNALRVAAAGQRRRVAAIVDSGDLRRRGEGHDLVFGAAFEEHVEVVKIAPSGAHDDDSSWLTHSRHTSFKGLVHGTAGPRLRRSFEPLARSGAAPDVIALDRIGISLHWENATA